MDEGYASPEELLDELARIRADLSRRRDRQDERASLAQAQRIERTLRDRCPPGWLGFPQLQSAIGATWYDLNLLEKARASYLLAVQAEDHVGQVPIRDIERLANIEARLGERRGTLKGSAGATGDAESGQALIETAIGRLDGLNTLLSVRAQTGSTLAPPFNAERSALLGSAYKRLAGLHAQRILSQQASATERAAAGKAMAAALGASSAAYRAAERNPDSGQFFPYQALNRLAMEALAPQAADSPRAAAIEVARQCANAAAQANARGIDPWDEIMQAEALLVERMLDGTLGSTGDAGLAVLNELADAYALSLSNVIVKPSQIESMASQMELLSRFADALSLIGDPKRRLPLRRIADRLLELAKRLHPGRNSRGDRPANTPASAAPAPRAAPTTKGTATKKIPARRASARNPKASRK
jgi:hypothetical protein